MVRSERQWSTYVSAGVDDPQITCESFRRMLLVKDTDGHVGLRFREN